MGFAGAGVAEACRASNMPERSGFIPTYKGVAIGYERTGMAKTTSVTANATVCISAAFGGLAAYGVLAVTAQIRRATTGICL